MAKRARELNRNGNGASPDELTFSSGITVKMLPFPAGLWEDVNLRAFQDFPDPPIPQKTVKVLGGTEDIDNPDDPEYKAKKRKTDTDRSSLLLEAILDICPQIDLTVWEPQIKRLEKYSTKFPDDPDDRRVEFLTRFVLRTKGDFANLMIFAVEQILIDDPEVAERVRYFQRELEGAAATYLDAPGATEGKQLEVPPPAENP